MVEVGMLRSPAVAMLVALITLCATLETAAAKAARSRHAAASRPIPSQTMLRKKPPPAAAPSRGDSAWMDRASETNGSAGGGGGM
jgi:hypothetical protein